MLLYADTDDLTAYPGVPSPLPDDAEQLLRVASRQVRHATRFALYDTDADGYPSNEDLRGVFREATVAQVAMWLHLGITPTSGVQSLGSRVASKAAGGRSITYREDSAELTAKRAAVAEQITPGTEAALILSDSGLLSWGPWAAG